MIHNELKDLVINEAYKLKQNAKTEELNRLDFSNLLPGDTDLCIYGQMCGFCFSERATHLLRLCAMPYSDHIDYGMVTDPLSGFREGWNRSFSAIEFYICLSGSKPEKLIAFLKSETETLKISDL